jgi:putative sterol carrier protein
MRLADQLAEVVERFNRHAAAHSRISEELAGLERTVMVALSDGTVYSVDLREGRLTHLRAEPAPSADLVLRTDPATLEALLTKQMGPMKAIVTRRLVIDGSLEDKLLFRKLL